jgi:hypothetical protein
MCVCLQYEEERQEASDYRRVDERREEIHLFRRSVGSDQNASNKVDTD